MAANHEKHGLVDKLFHHKDKSEDQVKPSGVTQDQEKKPSELQKLEQGFKKDEASFKEYIKKDEEMQREGNGAEYGGLM